VLVLPVRDGLSVIRKKWREQQTHNSACTCSNVADTLQLLILVRIR